MRKRSENEFPEQRRRRRIHPLVIEEELRIINEGKRPSPGAIAELSRKIYRHETTLTERDERKLRTIYRHDNYKEPWNRQQAVQLVLNCCISMELMPSMVLMEAALHPIRLPLDEMKTLLSKINMFLNTR